MTHLTKDVYIYGAGNTGKLVRNILTTAGYNITAFIDIKSKNDLTFEAYDVLSLDNISIKKENTLILAIFNRDVNLKELKGELVNKYAFESIVDVLEFYQIFKEQTPEMFWLTDYTKFEQNYEQIIETKQLFDDQQSKEIFEKLIKSRFEYNLDFIPNPETSHEQYFPDFINNISSFVDCGAFDGDTIRALYHKYGKIKQIFAFEPDIHNYNKLTRNNIDAFSENAICFPLGLSNYAQKIRFSTGAGEASAISDNGTDLITCVALDDVLAMQTIDYLKMDIEGAEYDALLGAKKIIRNMKPKLAISVYHCPSHLWLIPNLIKAMNADYKLFLRCYGNLGFDTVLYAI